MQNVSKKYVSGRLIIEGYSSKFSKYLISNNQKINIQISVCHDEMILGYPLIKNSF